VGRVLTRVRPQPTGLIKACWRLDVHYPAAGYWPGFSLATILAVGTVISVVCVGIVPHLFRDFVPEIFFQIVAADALGSESRDHRAPPAPAAAANLSPER
jgi:hypothetical protein